MLLCLVKKAWLRPSIPNICAQTQVHQLEFRDLDPAFSSLELKIHFLSMDPQHQAEVYLPFESSIQAVKLNLKCANEQDYLLIGLNGKNGQDFMEIDTLNNMLK